jgi:hypothetical protein
MTTDNTATTWRDLVDQLTEQQRAGATAAGLPTARTVAATKIHEALTAHIGDLLTLVNKLGHAACR